MKMGETRKKRYVLSVDECAAIIKAIDILTNLERDDDIAEAVQSSALGNICEATDVLQAVLDNDCQEIGIEED